AGGVIESPQSSGNHRNGIYDLVGAHNVDGLVLLSGTLGNRIGAARLARYCERFGALPMVSVAVQVDGMPTVIDDTGGIRDAIRHLIDVHGYQRIAFVRGPEEN